MMKRFRFLAALVLAFAPVLGAQRATAFELGAFLQYSKYDDFTGLKNGIGGGGRFGVYLLRNIALEYEGDVTKTRSARLGDLTALNNRIDALFYFPVGSKLRLLAGGGWTGTQYHSDTTKNQFDSGANAVLGFKYCVNENWALRGDVNADFKDPSDQTLSGERTRTYNIRAGFSRFLGGRAKNSPCFQSEPKAPRPAPAPTPVAPIPVQAPPPPPAATVTISASPSSVMAGQSSTLQWSAMNATSCSAPWMTAGATAGSQSVSPPATTSYTVTCTGAGGSGSGSATVTVTQPPPPPVPTPVPAPTRRELLTLRGVHFAFDKVHPDRRRKGHAPASHHAAQGARRFQDRDPGPHRLDWQRPVQPGPLGAPRQFGEGLPRVAGHCGEPHHDAGVRREPARRRATTRQTGARTTVAW